MDIEKEPAPAPEVAPAKEEPLVHTLLLCKSDINQKSKRPLHNLTRLLTIKKQGPSQGLLKMSENIEMLYKDIIWLHFSKVLVSNYPNRSRVHQDIRVALQKSWNLTKIWQTESPRL
jgi:hypothetical protein